VILRINARKSSVNRWDFSIVRIVVIVRTVSGSCIFIPYLPESECREPVTAMLTGLQNRHLMKLKFAMRKTIGRYVSVEGDKEGLSRLTYLRLLTG